MFWMGENGVSLRRNTNPAEIVRKARSGLHFNAGQVTDAISAVAQDHAVRRAADPPGDLTDARTEIHPLRGDPLGVIAFVTPFFPRDKHRTGVYESRRFKGHAWFLVYLDWLRSGLLRIDAFA